MKTTLTARNDENVHLREKKCILQKHKICISNYKNIKNAWKISCLINQPGFGSMECLQYSRKWVNLHYIGWKYTVFFDKYLSLYTS